MPNPAELLRRQQETDPRAGRTEPSREQVAASIAAYLGKQRDRSTVTAAEGDRMRQQHALTQAIHRLGGGPPNPLTQRFGLRGQGAVMPAVSPQGINQTATDVAVGLADYFVGAPVESAGRLGPDAVRVLQAAGRGDFGEAASGLGDLGMNLLTAGALVPALQGVGAGARAGRIAPAALAAGRVPAGAAKVAQRALPAGQVPLALGPAQVSRMDDALSRVAAAARGVGPSGGAIAGHTARGPGRKYARGAIDPKEVARIARSQKKLDKAQRYTEISQQIKRFQRPPGRLAGWMGTSDAVRAQNMGDLAGVGGVAARLGVANMPVKEFAGKSAAISGLAAMGAGAVSAASVALGRLTRKENAAVTMDAMAVGSQDAADVAATAALPTQTGEPGSELAQAEQDAHELRASIASPARTEQPLADDDSWSQFEERAKAVGADLQSRQAPLVDKVAMWDTWLNDEYGKIEDSVAEGIANGVPFDVAMRHRDQEKRFALGMYREAVEPIKEQMRRNDDDWYSMFYAMTMEDIKKGDSGSQSMSVEDMRNQVRADDEWADYQTERQTNLEMEQYRTPEWTGAIGPVRNEIMGEIENLPNVDQALAPYVPLIQGLAQQLANTLDDGDGFQSGTELMQAMQANPVKYFKGYGFDTETLNSASVAKVMSEIANVWDYMRQRMQMASSGAPPAAVQQPGSAGGQNDGGQSWVDRIPLIGGLLGSL